MATGLPSDIVAFLAFFAGAKRIVIPIERTDMTPLTARSRHFVVAIAAALVASVCATSFGQVPSQTQTALAKLAEPYSEGLRKAGITSVMVYGNGARV